MKFAATIFKLLAGCALASTCIGLAPAQAGQLHGGWNYTIDSFDDGSDAGKRGAKSNYEFYGMALKETADQVFIAINSNQVLGGVAAGNAHANADTDPTKFDGYIHYGDLFFNFENTDLGDAQGDLFAIKFDAGNDSGVSEIGVYSNVIGQNVTAQNKGFSSMESHRKWANKKYTVKEEYEVVRRGRTRIRRRNVKVQGTASMGDLSHNEYFEQGKRAVSNSIKYGDFLGGISFLNGEELEAAGLDFGAVNAGVTGRHTIGFSFDRNLLPDGDYIAHVFAECINDGLALKGNLPIVRLPEGDNGADVPEPGLMAGVLLLGGLGLMKRREMAAD